MAKKKLLHLGNLQSFWSKAEAWITVNFEALFEQGEKFESDINSLDSRINALEDDWAEFD